MIKGIDSQIITGRTTDLMRDNSARLKGDEFNQLLHNKTQQNDVSKELHTVTDVQDRNLRKVDDQDDDSKKKKKQQEQEAKEKKEQAVTMDNKLNDDLNAVSGNETVGYVKRSKIDIEI